MRRHLLIGPVALIVIFSLLVGAAQLIGRLRSGEVVAAYVYAVTQHQRYLLVGETNRRLNHLMTLPEEPRRSVIFAPHGRHLLIPYNDDGLTQLLIYDVATGHQYRNPPEYQSCNPALNQLHWSPDGMRMLFLCTPNMADPEAQGVHVMDFAERRTRQIYDGSAEDVRWSPDGEHVLINGRDGLFVVASDAGSPPLQLIGSPAGAYAAAWSPDGQQVAFVSARGLHVRPLDAEANRLYMPGMTVRAGPFWSPDGRYVAAVADAIEPGWVYVVDQEAETLTHIGAGRVKIDHAARIVWSPDSRFLAVERYHELTHDKSIYVSDPAGGRVWQLSESGIQPVWSPNSAHIAFTDVGINPTETGECLHVVTYDGVDVTTTCRAADGAEARWLSDGTRLMYIRRTYRDVRVSPRQLFVVMPDSDRSIPVLGTEYSVLRYTIWSNH
ncbi:MAG: hypothetical protein ACOCYT_02125 [Chloroflexota bacterium]